MHSKVFYHMLSRWLVCSLESGSVNGLSSLSLNMSKNTKRHATAWWINKSRLSCSISPDTKSVMQTAMTSNCKRKVLSKRYRSGRESKRFGTSDQRRNLSTIGCILLSANEICLPKARTHPRVHIFQTQALICCWFDKTCIANLCSAASLQIYL